MGDILGVKEYRLALRENRLLGLKCKACGFVTTPPRLACRHCGALDAEIVQLTGRGKITTFTSVYIPPENRRGQQPYLVVTVELEEGPWIMGNLTGADPANSTLDLIGKRVYMNNNLIPNDRNPPEDISPMFVL
jgi:uncharacterized protein